MPLPAPVTLDALARLFASLLLVGYVLPAAVLPRLPGVPRADRVVLGGACAALGLIVAGYALAAAHLYEWMTLVAALALGAYALRRRVMGPRRRSPDLAAAVLRELDDVALLPARLGGLLVGAWGSLRRLRPPAPWAMALGVAATVIFGMAAWMRWGMNLMHAAPLYSDFVVVLAWVKDIDEQRLFPDGVYLKGFHLVLAGLSKISLSRPELFVKFAGPAVGVGMILTVAFFAYRVTGRAVPALFAALVYGTLPVLLPYEAARQAATDSQEFGNLLVLPAAWFVYRAWTRPETPAYRWGAAVLLTLIATVHPIAILNAGGAAVAATIAGVWARGADRRTLRVLVGLLAAGAVVAVVPPAVGLITGRGFYASSAAFASATSAAVAPQVMPAVWVGVGCAALACVVLPLLRRSREAGAGALMVLLFLGFTLAVRQAPRLGIHSAALMARSGEAVALAVPPALALGWSMVEEALDSALGRQRARWASLGLLAAVTAGAWLWQPPRVLDTYRMDSDEFVATYERILDTLPATDWVAVSDRDGYDYAFGYGFFLNPDDFLGHVAPEGPWPSYRYDDGRTEVMAEDTVLIFVDKQAWVAPLDSERARLPARLAADQGLQGWVTAWQARGGRVTVYFDGRYIRVYALSRPTTASATIGRLFGEG